VIGVGQYHLDPQVYELLGGQGFDGALCADGHKGRGIDGTVSGTDPAQTGTVFFFFVYQFKGIGHAIQVITLAKLNGGRAGPLAYEHGISIAVETISLGNSLPVCIQDKLPSGKCRDQHEQGALGKVKIGDQGIRHLKPKTRIDEKIAFP
jgi:hypothetical protein